MRVALAVVVALVVFSRGVQAASSEPGITQDMPYAAARSALVRRGWQAEVKNPNQLGDLQSSLQEWFLKKGFLEIRECLPTGLGTCTAIFHDASGNTLYVYTGEAGDMEPRIRSWCFNRDDVNCGAGRRPVRR